MSGEDAPFDDETFAAAIAKMEASGTSGCNCCLGRGVVVDIEGRDRPCSMCKTEAFNEWAARRRPKPVIAA